MADDFSQNSIQDILGIGPVTAQRLNECGIYRVSDLLRISSQRLHAFITDLASHEEVYGWQRTAELSQVKWITPSLAQALVESGLDSIERLAFADYADLESQAIESQDDEPDATAMRHEILRDASVLHYTGVFRGSLVNSEGQAVANANLSIGRSRATSDARGRFNILKIRAAANHHLRAELEDETTASFESVGVVFDHRAIAVKTVVLPPDEQMTAILDEYDGDVLPPFDGRPVTSKVHDDSQLREEDFLTVQKTYADGVHVKLYSEFRALAAGRFLIRTYKVPLSRLGVAEVSWRDRFYYKRGKFKPTKVTHRTMPRIRKYRRLLRQDPSMAQPIQSAEDLLNRLNRLYQED